MSDNSNLIEVIFESAEVNTDEEFKSDSRYVLGKITGKYEIDQDLSLVLYFQRDTNGDWDNTGTYTLNQDEQKFKQILPPGLVASDFYIKVWGNILNTCKITSLKVSVKELPIGKFG